MLFIKLFIVVFFISCSSTHHSRFFILKESPHRYGEFSYIPKKIAHLDIVFDKSVPKEIQSELKELLLKMNNYLDSKNYLTEKIDRTLVSKEGEAELYVGVQDINITQRYLDDKPIDKKKNKDLILNIKDPSIAWINSVKQALADANKSHLLITKLAIRRYWIKEDNFIGKKRLELGIKNELSIPISTEKDYPIEVFQLQSILVNADGQIQRALAEAIAPNYSRNANSITQIHEKIDKAFASKLSQLTFINQKNNSLRWEHALNNSLAQILGRTDLIK